MVLVKVGHKTFNSPKSDLVIAEGDIQGNFNQLRQCQCFLMVIFTKFGCGDLFGPRLVIPRSEKSI